MLWADGCLDAPMLPKEPFVIRCRGCNAYVFLEDMPVVGEVPRALSFLEAEPDEVAQSEAERRANDQVEVWEELPFVREFDWPVYVEAIRQLDGSVAPARLRRLRIRLWHRLNDLRRDHPPRHGDRRDANGRRIYGPEAAFAGIYPPRPFTPAERETFQANLTALLDLADVEPAVPILIQCDALRELGRFDEAVDLLGRYHHRDEDSQLAELILALCAKRDAEPTYVPPPTD